MIWNSVYIKILNNSQKLPDHCSQKARWILETNFSIAYVDWLFLSLYVKEMPKYPLFYY